jgi:hypothetical protein
MRQSHAPLKIVNELVNNGTCDNFKEKYKLPQKNQSQKRGHITHEKYLAKSVLTYLTRLSTNLNRPEAEAEARLNNI